MLDVIFHVVSVALLHLACPSAIKDDIESIPLWGRCWIHTVKNIDHFILIIHLMNNGICIKS